MFWLIQLKKEKEKTKIEIIIAKKVLYTTSTGMDR